MKRQIIQIDEEKCNGCGECVPNCHEGALQIIDDKARLISDLMCDGLGACIGHCPEGAITMEEREAEPYNETLVMGEMIKKGKNTVIAHLKHLKEHDQKEFVKEGVGFLKDHEHEIDFKLEEVMEALHPKQLVVEQSQHVHGSGGCPGSQSMSFGANSSEPTTQVAAGEIPSQLTHWPVQMHLLNPGAPHFHNTDLVLAADCTAFSMGDFHNRFLKGKTLAIACPKLDHNREVYVEKLVSLIDDAMINTIQVIKMQVPCCTGLVQLAQMALENAERKVPIKSVTIGIDGSIMQEVWI
jgi:NAD-dependent dihydropyrimidine dehydrogenase PreA subunit